VEWGSRRGKRKEEGEEGMRERERERERERMLRLEEGAGSEIHHSLRVSTISRPLGWKLQISSSLKPTL